VPLALRRGFHTGSGVKYSMVEGRPPALYVSAIRFFKSRGPGDFKIGFSNWRVPSGELAHTRPRASLRFPDPQGVPLPLSSLWALFSLHAQCGPIRSRCMDDPLHLTPHVGICILCACP
jgi:hypothetical protein